MVVNLNKIKDGNQNETQIIEALEGAKYVNEFMDSLPNGIFNKKILGVELHQ